MRILLDDILAHGDEQVLLAIHEHPNITVKIFNPNINIGKATWSKVKKHPAYFDEINQRMHNKSLIIDGSYAVTGGRNVGDEYYDLNSNYNFRDRDVALFAREPSQYKRVLISFGKMNTQLRSAHCCLLIRIHRLFGIICEIIVVRLNDFHQFLEKIDPNPITTFIGRKRNTLDRYCSIHHRCSLEE